ncbi:hypothetical protein [Kitasatospora purpeofusca]|uniref:hypothetical protein n=1 Tax=Kitasatospora purpeofusca TaxID=67352 RepID=UPI00382B8221
MPGIALARWGEDKLSAWLLHDPAAVRILPPGRPTPATTPTRWSGRAGRRRPASSDTRSRGRPPRHGGEFVLGDPVARGTEQTVTTTATRRYGVAVPGPGNGSTPG